MNEFARRILIAFALAAGLMLLTPRISLSQSGVTPQPVPSPNAPTNQNAPLGLDLPPVSQQGSARHIDPQNEKNVRLDVQRLYALASELKEEVDNTNENAVLSVAMLKKAHEIEKLAKEIRNREKH
jgi:hypothetical protein